MTHEEMAQVLEALGGRARMEREEAEHAGSSGSAAKHHAREISCEAGAAALRAAGWKQVPDDPDKIPDCPGTHRVCGRWLDGEWMTETETSPTFIDYSKPTHYFELPAPPEAA